MTLEDIKTLEEVREIEELNYIFKVPLYWEFFKSLDKEYIFFYVDNNIHFCKRSTLSKINEMNNLSCSFNISATLDNHLYTGYCSRKGKLKILSKKIEVKKAPNEEAYIIGEFNDYLTYAFYQDTIWESYLKYDRKRAFPLKSFSSLYKYIWIEEDRELCLTYFKVMYPQWHLWKELTPDMLKTLYKPIDKLIELHTKQALFEYIHDERLQFKLNKLSFHNISSFINGVQYLNKSDW